MFQKALELTLYFILHCNVVGKYGKEAAKGSSNKRSQVSIKYRYKVGLIILAA